MQNTSDANPAPSVLLVDDDDFVRALMCAMLARLGVTQVIEAGNGREALAALEDCEREPAFVICDVYMPDMDGIELMQALAQVGYRGQVILQSGVNPETLQLARDLATAEGVRLIGAFLKPIPAEVLADALGLPLDTASHDEPGSH